MFKPHFTSSPTKKATEALQSMKELYGHFKLGQASHIVTLGGDGHMLKTLHKHKETQLPIFGMNRGNFGFLMNHFEEKNLIERINQP
ncbi:MAG: NAD(+)/NADH kinase, partial [Alphaproteobacteria bacterium]